jgi:small subunit ribosomal protein S6
VNTYEIMVLLDNREVKKGWDATREQVKAVLTKYGAEIIAARRWDERKLTYEIKKQKRGTYLLIYAKLGGERVRDLRREMELTEWVLRHVIVRVESVPPEAFEPEKDFPEVRVGEEDRGEAMAAAAEARNAEASRAEHSRAEVSRAEASRAEHKSAEHKTVEAKTAEGGSEVTRG